MLKDRSSNQPAKVTPAQDGTLMLGAEQGKGIGPKIAFMPEESAFGWFTAADRVEWDVQVEKTGGYEVYLNWSVSDQEAGKPFKLQAGSQSISGIVGQTGSWEQFKTQKIGVIRLNAGRQKMVFKPSSKFPTTGGKGALLDLRGVKLVPVKGQM
jgi:hypothetical protein